MKLKRILLLFLGIILCFGLVACGSDSGEDPEILRKDLASMTDEELIPELLNSYANYEEPAVFSAEMSWIYRSGEITIAEMEGKVLSNGVDRMMEMTCTVEDTTKSERYIYKDGVCYIDAETKTKMKWNRPEVVDYFTERYPSFGSVDDYNFVAKDLWRSDDGSYSLVLYLPANSIADSADILSPLTAVGNDTAPVTMSDFSDIYLTLRFSPEGKLIGQTLGFDCVMNADGVETEGTVTFRFFLSSENPFQTPISAPEDADTYSDGAPDSSEDSVTDDENENFASDSE